jgi:hypothetical protein
VTPIKCFRRLGNLLWTEDWAGHRVMVAMAASDEQAKWLADTFTMAHHCPVLEWDEEYDG